LSRCGEEVFLAFIPLHDRISFCPITPSFCNSNTSDSPLHIPQVLIGSRTAIGHARSQARMPHTQRGTQHPLSWVPNPRSSSRRTIQARRDGCGIASQVFTEGKIDQGVQCRVGGKRRKGGRWFSRSIRRRKTIAVCMFGDGPCGPGAAQLDVERAVASVPKTIDGVVAAR